MNNDELIKEIIAQEMEGFEEETENLPDVVLKDVVSNPNNRKEDKSDDYSLVRQTIRQQLEMMDTASRRALQNALSCDQPRMMEVFSQLMTTMTITAEKLLKVQKQMNELEGVNPASTSIQAENVFFGSTNDLLEEDGGADDSKVIDGKIINDGK